MATDALSVMKPVQQYNKTDYFQTASGLIVSKTSVLCGSQNIQIVGNSIIKENVILRGDLANLRIGRHVVIGANCVIHPAFKKSRNAGMHIPLAIQDYVVIGENCVVRAASIGSNVTIGDNCIIDQRCVIKDKATILPGTTLAPDTTVPPYTMFGGCPGRFVKDLPESVVITNREQAKESYCRFLQLPQSVAS